MRTEPLGSLIQKSFQGMLTILFRPFSLKKWLLLLLVASLAGVLGGGGSGNFSGSRDSGDSVKHETRLHGNETKILLVSQHEGKHDALSKETLIFLIGLASVIFITYLFLAMFLNSRFIFVWFRNIAGNNASVIEPYSKHVPQAKSFFSFSITIFFISFFLLGLLAWHVFVSMRSHGVFLQGHHVNFHELITLFLPLVLCFLAVLVIAAILSFIVNAFIVPIMAFDAISIRSAFLKFREIFFLYKGDICFFMLIYFLLSIAGAIIQFILVLATILTLLLLGAVLFGIPYLIMGLLLKAKIALIVYCLALGVPFILLAILVLIATRLPIAVFFRLFSIEYLLSLNSGYTQSTLENYSTDKHEHLCAKAPIVCSIVSLFMVGFIFILGVFAAIAIPNYMRAKQHIFENKPLNDTKVNVGSRNF